MGQCWTRLCKRPCKRHHVFGSGKVCHITKVESWEEKLTEAKHTGKIVVVKFCSSWCMPCKEIAAPYRELADKYSSLVFLAVDIDEMAELSSSWDIKATPTFYFLRAGQPMDKLVGANKLELQKKIATIVDLTTKM